MAVKPYRIILLAITIIAGAAAIHVHRSRHLTSKLHDERKFVSTYIDLSIARERYSDYPDSLRDQIAVVYERNGADSIWMAQYAKKLSPNIDRSDRIWNEIVVRLDTLRKAAAPESILIF